MNDGLAALEGATPHEIAERSAGNLLRRALDRAGGRGRRGRVLASDKARFITGSQFVLDAGLLSR